MDDLSKLKAGIEALDEFDSPFRSGRMVCKKEVLALIATHAAEPAPVAVEGAPDLYLICKYGGYYRPNAQGYTNNVAEAGRYTLAEAISHTHPNGPDGPRDGMTYIPAPPRAALTEQANIRSPVQSQIREPYEGEDGA